MMLIMYFMYHPSIYHQSIHLLIHPFTNPYIHSFMCLSIHPPNQSSKLLIVLDNNCIN